MEWSSQTLPCPLLSLWLSIIEKEISIKNINKIAMENNQIGLEAFLCKELSTWQCKGDVRTKSIGSTRLCGQGGEKDGATLQMTSKIEVLWEWGGESNRGNGGLMKLTRGLLEKGCQWWGRYKRYWHRGINGARVGYAVKREDDTIV